jgi:hypothetical protein
MSRTTWRLMVASHKLVCGSCGTSPRFGGPHCPVHVPNVGQITRSVCTHDAQTSVCRSVQAVTINRLTQKRCRGTIYAKALPGHRAPSRAGAIVCVRHTIRQRSSVRLYSRRTLLGQFLAKQVRAIPGLIGLRARTSPDRKDGTSERRMF